MNPTQRYTLAALVALAALPAFPVRSAQVWTGPTTTFTLAAGANPADPASQDRLTPNVWITRAGTQGIFNFRSEAGYVKQFSPAGTEWAYGSLDNYAGLTYDNWEDWFGGSLGGGPPSTVGKDAVLHLIEEDIYLAVKFTSWGGPGGGFSWTRTTPAPLSSDPARFISFVLADKFPSPPLTTNQVPVIPNGLATLRWRGDTNAQFDLLYATALGPDAAWKLAQPNIPADPSGTNTLVDPPYLASPAYPANTQLFYRVVSLPPPAAPLPIGLEIVATGLVSPTVLTHAGDGSGRLFIADQPGQVRVADAAGNLLATPFLDLSDRLVPLRAGYDERGLLGLTFHPGYTTNGRFFVYYSAPPSGPGFDNTTVLSEFSVFPTNSNAADPASERVLLTINQPEFNHEGAALAFGPDGYLYLGPGDGGGASDQHGTTGNAQSLATLLGKILRLDVDSGSPYGIPSDNPFVNLPGARPEIYAYGLRNPWRFSFDRGGARQGFIADVGQNFFEEINLLRKGANYGWRILEGNHLFDPTVAGALGVDIAALDFPIFEYRHGPLGISVIGGFVYRGAAYPELNGKYVFGDFSTTFAQPDGQLYYLDQTRPGIWEHFRFRLPPASPALGRFLKGLGEDEAGELYVLSTTSLGPSGASGDVRRLVKP